MPNLNKLMKQAMKAQQQAQEIDAAMASRTVEASSGGGALAGCCRQQTRTRAWSHVFSAKLQSLFYKGWWGHPPQEQIICKIEV